jgi:integrase/recombinase XerD
MSIYSRAKNKGGKWRYTRIAVGRGVKTGDLRAPFYARITRGGKQVWQSLLAQTFKEAHDEVAVMLTRQQAQAHGLLAPGDQDGRLTIDRAIDAFLEQSTMSKKKNSVREYRHNLSQFRDAAGVKYLADVSRDVLRVFRDYMNEQGYSPRTQHNRMVTVLSLLKENNVKTDFSLVKDLPKYEEDPPVPFTEEDLKKLFGAMTDKETVCYKFFLGTACREQEVQYATWQDIDFEKMEFHVRPKKDVGFTPKNHEKRSVPMPQSLVAVLKQYRKTAKHTRWLFVSKSGGTEGHFLRKFKQIGLRAGVNCGECWTTLTKGRYDQKSTVKVSCKTDPVCDHVFLHPLRKTCATRWESAGVPVRTIQAWLGHKDLSTTQGYLGVTDSSKLRGNIDRAFGD